MAALLSALLAALCPAPPARAATASELFLALPEAETQNLSPTARRALLEKAGQGASGYSPPSREGFWLTLYGDDALTLSGLSRSPVTYKVFRGREGSDLFVVCRSRQTSGPSSEDLETENRPPYDLSLYQSGFGTDMVKVGPYWWLPEIGVLDFTTLDTLKDPQARLDLAAIDRTFQACLTCHASAEDPAALDILTVTSVNGYPCSGIMSHFKVLPLSWDGRFFRKPLDRAVTRDPRLEEEPPTQPRGLYYRKPGS
jgi:hypothetical protein